MPDEGKTFSPIALWATNTYTGDLIGIAFEGDESAPPPENRRYFLELLSVPEGVEGAPPEGTVWEVPAHGLFSVILPTYQWWEDKGGPPGEPHGYLFSFTITPEIPEPGTMVCALLAAGVLALRRR